MFRNYLKIAWRNLVNSKFYSIINITGLTVGLTVGILILIWVQDEWSFNHFKANTTNIYRVNSIVGTGASKQVWASSTGPVAAYASREIPNVKNIVRISGRWDYRLFSWNNRVFKAERMGYADPGLFDMFDIKFLQGNERKPFTDNYSVILTESVAKKYFGNENAVGKVIQADHKDNYTVTGVVQDFPENSSIHFAMLFPVSIMAAWYDGKGFWKSMDTDWGNFNFTTLVELRPDGSPKKVTDQLTAITMKNDPNAKRNIQGDAYILQPISELNLYNPDGSPANIQVVQIFIIVAVLILLIASINYINLSTARSILRAREVSIRKIIGAQKKQLLFQFILESVLFFLISLILVLGLINLLMPLFNSISGKNISFSLFDWSIWKIILLMVAGTLLASAIYPAIQLSSFAPIQALKGKLMPGIGSATFRKILVTVQFVFSIVLIAGTLIIGRQLKYVREKDPGYDRTQVFSFSITDSMVNHINAIKTDLVKLPGVQSAALADNNLINLHNTTGDIEWDGKAPNNSFIITPMGVDENFIPLTKIQLVAGSNFTGSKADSSHYILNETAVNSMGIKDPVGKNLSLWGKKGTIIGVAKDFNINSLKYKIKPTVIHFRSYEYNMYYMYVKTTGKEASTAIAAAGNLWKQYNTGFLFDYSFLDDDYDKLYRSEQRTATLFTIFSIIAILISCLGLFGLATYTAQVRIKEIGIRKTLGASVLQITSLLSFGFLRLVFLAILIASPIAWWAMNNWLHNFEYRLNISWWVFALAGGAAILIAFLTISFQTIRAAMANPVKSLRSE